MLKGISPVVSPVLLKTLSEMGHGDEIVISDAHFPAHCFGRDGALVLRADGIPADALLAGIAPLFELDSYATPVVMMDAVPGDTLDPAVEERYRAAKEMLASNYLLVKEICKAIGIHDQRHFSREFKRRFGLSPLEYRRQALKD